MVLYRYTGHVPGLDWMVGGTYGQDSHKALLSIQPYPNRQVSIVHYSQLFSSGSKV